MSTTEGMKVMLNSFNKSVNDAIFSTIYDCKGVSIGTIDILKDQINSDNMSKLQFEQELLLLQQCGLSRGFNDDLYHNLYRALYEQMNLLNKSDKIQLHTIKRKNIEVVIKYQLKEVVYRNNFPQLISQVVYQIINITRNSKSNELDKSLIDHISNMMHQALNNFTNEIEVIYSIRKELTMNSSKEGFIGIFKDGVRCKSHYMILLFLFFVFIIFCSIDKNFT